MPSLASCAGAEALAQAFGRGPFRLPRNAFTGLQWALPAEACVGLLRVEAQVGLRGLEPRTSTLSV